MDCLKWIFRQAFACACAAVIAGCATTDPDAAPYIGQQAFLEACEPWDEWDKPAPPFRIYGNSYYVGTCGISAILITGDQGHVLIDGGTNGAGPLVERSIAQLGFAIEDVEILLHSHEHFDHVGGLAYLQAVSGARVIASSGAAQALRTGETQPDDPQYGLHDPFEPVEVSRELRDGEVISLGRLALIAMETPGHTSGALTWSWWSCQRTACKLLVYADSLSPVSGDKYRFSDHPGYLARYRDGLARLAETPCDILLTPHPSASAMLERMAGGTGLLGEGDCQAYASTASRRLDARTQKERDGE